MAITQEHNNPELLAVANVFVDDIIETAKVEAAQRAMVIQHTCIYYYNSCKCFV